jgi:hypothetical protein
MTLPASGAISMSQVNTELGLTSTATISLNDSNVRTLFGKASGVISMSDGYGKSNQFAFTISTNQTNANLRTLAVNAGWNQTAQVVATIGSGVNLTSTASGTPALTINGSFPNGVTLTNNGVIAGRGGTGGIGMYTAGGMTAGAAGTVALSVSSAVSITNNGTIGGGGGGGGGGMGNFVNNCGGNYYGGGGGGGGGAGNGAGGSQNGGSGGVTTAGSGGPGLTDIFATGYAGGNGGTLGVSGSAGPTGGAAGGGAGAAVSGNANITWVATGTRLGAIA